VLKISKLNFAYNSKSSVTGSKVYKLVKPSSKYHPAKVCVSLRGISMIGKELKATGNRVVFRSTFKVRIIVPVAFYYIPLVWFLNFLFNLFISPMYDFSNISIVIKILKPHLIIKM